MFEWQAGNTTRFINFNTVTDVEYKEDYSTFDVYCGQTIVSVPNELREQFKAKYEEWKKTKMKNYKIGDTIYIKDQIVAIDTDPCTHSKYCTIDKRWVSNTAIIDELPTAEPVKPVLPKGVAKELEIIKKLNFTFDGYIMGVIDNHYLYTNSHTFWMNSDDGVIKILMDAWYNGYTIEQVPRYKVYVPGTNKQFMYLKRGGRAKVDNKKATPITPQSINNYLTAGGNRDLYWFTDEEITKFDLQDCERKEVK